MHGRLARAALVTLLILLVSATSASASDDFASPKPLYLGTEDATVDNTAGTVQPGETLTTAPTACPVDHSEASRTMWWGGSRHGPSSHDHHRRVAVRHAPRDLPGRHRRPGRLPGRVADRDDHHRLGRGPDVPHPGRQLRREPGPRVPGRCQRRDP